MEFYLPSAGLGAPMPQNESPPAIDWTHPNPFNSAEARRPRHADDGSHELEQWMLGRTPTDSLAQPDPMSIDTIFEPSRLSLDQYTTAEMPARHLDVERMTLPDTSSGRPRRSPPNDDDDDDENDDATNSMAQMTTRISSSHSSQAAASPEGAAPTKLARRRSSASASTEEARAKNRLAASKCRRKKKVEERELEERQRRLNLQRAVLREAADALVHEVLALKHEVLRHSTCGNAPLDHYIAEAARRGSSFSTTTTSSSSSASPPANWSSFSSSASA